MISVGLLVRRRRVPYAAFAKAELHMRIDHAVDVDAELEALTAVDVALDALTEIEVEAA